MIIDRVKNTKRNIVYGVLERMVSLIGPFILRTVLLYELGAQYLGLNGLFSSILGFLSLTELGVGSALVYAMYKPIAEDDTEKVCALLKLYKEIYRIIGLVMLVLGMCVMPFLRYLIKGSYPADINLYILYGIYLFNSVISYFLFAYKQSLLQAYQRNDIISRLTAGVQLAMYSVQIITLYLFRNYYYYVCLIPFFTLLNNLVNSVIVDKLYPKYRCRGSIDKEEKKKIKKNVFALIGTKMSAIVLHSSDNIVISMFLGLEAVTVYGNYYMVITAVVGFITILYSSMRAGIGNALVAESLQNNYRSYRILSKLNGWLVIWCTCCFLCLFPPFMRIWVGEELIMPVSFVLLLAVYFFVYMSNGVNLMYKDSAGLWWQDRFRPYIVMSVNLIMNIILVQYWGLYGVIASTVAAMAIAWPWCGIVVYKYLFGERISKFAKESVLHIIKALAVCGVTFFVCGVFPCQNMFVEFMVRAGICIVVPNALLFLLNFKNTDFDGCLEMIRKIRC